MNLRAPRLRGFFQPPALHCLGICPAFPHLKHFNFFVSLAFVILSLVILLLDPSSFFSMDSFDKLALKVAQPNVSNTSLEI
jgi:hypothetical protein